MTIVLLGTTLACCSAAQPPHIIFTLTDDLGFNYPGFNNQEKAVITPTLDKLATTAGVILNMSYMYKYCSPSRGSFMSGRLPWKLPAVRCNLIPSSIPEGIPLGYTFLPKHLAKAGYVSTHIGKWVSVSAPLALQIHRICYSLHAWWNSTSDSTRRITRQSRVASTLAMGSSKAAKTTGRTSAAPAKCAATCQDSLQHQQRTGTSGSRATATSLVALSLA